jgi:hypothetical protein
MTVEPSELAELIAFIGRREPFDIAVTGISESRDRRARDDYREAGATWWLESLHDLRGDFDAMLARVADGP